MAVPGRVSERVTIEKVDLEPIENSVKTRYTPSGEPLQLRRSCGNDQIKTRTRMISYNNNNTWMM